MAGAVNAVPMGRREEMANLARRETLGFLGHLVDLVRKVVLEILEKTGIWVQREMVDHLDKPGIQEKWESLAPLEVRGR